MLHLAVPASSALHLSDYTVTLVGKILCYATVALAMDLVWGYTGILSLGHGLFFALGGYAMGMYLMRAIGRDGVYGDPVLPDFMVFLDWKELPWYWLGSDHFLQQALLVVLVPALLAFVFGWFAFRSRIRGVYFSIITQALTYAAMLLFFRNQTGFGGNNGFTDFKRILGFPLASPRTRVVLLVALGDPAPRRGRALPGPGALQAGAGAHRHPRRRGPGAVLRLRPGSLQALRLDALRGHLRRRRRALRAAGGHHQPRRDVPRQLGGDRHRRGARRARNAARTHPRRGAAPRRQERAHRRLPRAVALRARARSSSW